MIFNYDIYQIVNIREVDYAFMGSRYGVTPKRLDYQLIYCGSVEAKSEFNALENLFEIFNLRHPNDYKGRSLSVSDVVVINNKTYYCDSIGWTEFEFDKEI